MRTNIECGDILAGVQVIEDLGYSTSNHRYYNCKCLNCGREGVIPRERLRKCTDIACKFCSGRILDFKGMRIDGYTVIRETESRSKSRNIMWLCKCNKCGKTKYFSSGQLSSGSLRTCGCNKWKRPNKQFLAQMQPCV